MKIRQVLIDEKTATKLYIKHGITTEDLLIAIHYADEDTMNKRWSVDDVHGGRLCLRTEMLSGEYIYVSLEYIYVSLAPIDIDHGIWKCITAFLPTREDY